MTQQISDNPYLKDLGLELLSMENGTAEVGIRLQEQHMNSWQVMHGGIIMTLLDACMARAARSLQATNRRNIVRRVFSVGSGITDLYSS